MFNDQTKIVLVPSEYFSNDETLYGMSHQTGFRQFNPNKPAKDELLYKSLNDVRFPFTYQFIQYCGKPANGNGPYYLNANEDYVKYLVESMPASSMKGRNISMDRLYISISTSNWLLAENIISDGTLVSNRVGLPDEIKDEKNRNEFESSKY